MELVGIDGRWLRLQVALQRASARLNAQVEMLADAVYQIVDVEFFEIEREVLVRHLGALQYGLHEDAHTAVFVADDADIGAVAGRVGADGGVLQHLAG